MPSSSYTIQIINSDGQVVNSWLPGMAVEKQLITELANRVEAKGVGLGRTTAHVKQDVIDALSELLFDLKSQVNPL